MMWKFVRGGLDLRLFSSLRLFQIKSGQVYETLVKVELKWPSAENPLFTRCPYAVEKIVQIAIFFQQDWIHDQTI